VFEIGAFLVLTAVPGDKPPQNFRTNSLSSLLSSPYFYVVQRCQCPFLAKPIPVLGGR